MGEPSSSVPKLRPLHLPNRASDQSAAAAAAAAVQGAHQVCDLVANFLMPLGRGEVVSDAAGWRTEANQGRHVSGSHEMTIGGGGIIMLASVPFILVPPLSLVGISGGKSADEI